MAVIASSARAASDRASGDVTEAVLGRTRQATGGGPWMAWEGRLSDGKERMMPVECDRPIDGKWQVG
jgi:hypothetical protein